ncbi:MAG: tetratricopeptide repeat protein [Myxococcaceae bacterium]|nr:tetratricopeptide repeat protein [Myxococcaceae bacterium]
MSLAELKKAVVIAPEDIGARLDLAKAFADGGQLPEAMKQLHRALTIDPDHVHARRLHAELTRALNNRPEGWWSTALDHLERRRLDDAVLFGRAACEREPDDYRRWAELAKWCSYRRLTERARLCYGRALAISQREARILEDRDKLLQSMGEDDAVDLYSEAPLGPLHDALSLLVDGDVIGAKRVLAMADEGLQSTGFFHRIRGEVWQSEGETARAKKAFERAKDFDARPYRPGKLARLIDERTPGHIGVLGWTPYGGAVSALEALAVVGEGKLQFTGNVGDHIKESCSVAFTCLKAKGAELGIDGLVTGMDLHLHFTDIETTKEGFSAGLAFTLAGLSALRRQPLFPRLATTGAITLHGDVQRIEGIYEKVVAARIAGVRRLLYPRGNSADVKALAPLVTEGMQLFPVSSLGEALEHAFV